MSELLWLLILWAIIMLTVNWLLVWSSTPLSRKAIRQFFLQRLTSALPDIQLLSETNDLLTFHLAGESGSLYLAQLYLRCAENPYRTAIYVNQAVQAILEAFHENTRGLPAEWERLVLIQFVNSTAPLPPDAVLRSFVSTLEIGYVLPQEEAFRWVTYAELQQTGIDAEQLHVAALRNLERSCNTLIIDAPPTSEDENDEWLRFTTGDGLDAARLLVPFFFQRFSPRFGDNDLLVAIPTRDTLAMVSADDPQQARWLAWSTGQQSDRHAYPLYPQLLKVTEMGIEPWEE